MMCERCRALEDEVRHLRRELTYEIDHDLASQLKVKMGITPQMAFILAALYYAHGRTVSVAALLDALPRRDRSDSYRLVTVQISKLRRFLPNGAIKNIYQQGYMLSASGRRVVDRVREDAAVAA